MNPYTSDLHDSNRRAAFPQAPLVEEGAPSLVGERTLSQGTPSKPLFGALPIARWIPMDVHSMMDYGNGGLVGAVGMTAEDPRAKLASMVLAGSVVGVSLITDYRLSLASVVPIEVHEAIDHAWGLSAIALPFVLGYWKTEPKVALTHVIAGVSTILGSLVTDYRAWRRRR